MDKTEAMIMKFKKNPVLFDKTEKDYKDIVKKRDIWKAIGQKVGLTGTRWWYSPNSLLLCKILCTDTRLFLFLRCFAYTYSAMISSVSDSTCAMIPNDQILSLTARKRRDASKAVGGFPRSRSCSI